MLRIEDNERLTQIRPGTPMGELMRRHWRPVARPRAAKHCAVLAEGPGAVENLADRESA